MMEVNGQEMSGTATNAQGLNGSGVVEAVKSPEMSGSGASGPVTHEYEGSDAPQNWAMVVVMLAIVAGLAFGGVAMMYRRAEASKREAEIAMAMVQTERDRAEVAQKEARAQQRMAEQLRDQADQAGMSEAEANRLMQAGQPRAEAPKSDTASVDAAKADAAAKMISEKLSVPPVDHTPGAEMDMRTVLDAAAKKLEAGQVKGGPGAAGAVHSTLGNTYLSLGENAKAAQHLRMAIDLRKPVLGEKSAEIVKDEAALARANAALKK